MKFLKQSTAVTIVIGPFLDDMDGKTPETALTVANIDADLYKGATKSDLTLTLSGGNNDCVHIANGFYSLELTTGNVDTLGSLKLAFNVAGALPVWEDFIVLPAAVYDAMFGSGSIFVKAAKTLVNKAVQTKSTGVINYYDDDGSTILLTHTPTDAESTITRTPS
jgi:hypothetical protein